MITESSYTMVAGMLFSKKLGGIRDAMESMFRRTDGNGLEDVPLLLLAGADEVGPAIQGNPPGFLVS